MSSEESGVQRETDRLLPPGRVAPGANDGGAWRRAMQCAVVATAVVLLAVVVSLIATDGLRGSHVGIHEEMLVAGDALLGVEGGSGVDVPFLGQIHDPAGTYTAEALRDKVDSLPGLHMDLDFNMFAGYLTVSERNGRNIFYWYVESQNDPSTDPVVLWTNGGPGCSGLIGFGQEHGPFHFSRDGMITLNPYSWNKVANMLYIEVPAGVGFSYSDTPDDLVDVGDEETAVDNLVVVRKFFQRYPERLNNDFYISSESYGGHYIPQLAQKIVEVAGTPGVGIPFKGFLVGNPWIDPFTNDVAQVRAFYQHGLISRLMLEEWMANCSERSSYNHKKCPKGIHKMRKNMKYVSPYALDYPVCTEEKIDLDDAASSEVLQFLNQTATEYEFPRVNELPRFLPPDVKYLPCAEQHFKVWLNQRSVQEALNVHPGQRPVRWHACAPSKTLSYRRDDFLRSQLDILRELLAVARKGDLHLNMLVFSGDNDSVCSTSSTQAWIYDLADPIPGQDWREWNVEGQTAGFVTRFDLGDKTNSKFTFATIHGAGHEAAAYRPVEALQLFKMYLNGDL
ncbi:hypothetical protein ACHAXT_000684 [Thalassiosira profunda]